MATPQPNADGYDGLGWRFWCLVPLVGVAAGLAAGLLMLPLRTVQHLAWGEGEAGLLAAVARCDNPPPRWPTCVVRSSTSKAAITPMPIRRHDRWLYPIDGHALSAAIRFRRAKG